jgi:glycosyltransferase involved in cell wall biosynthesis
MFSQRPPLSVIVPVRNEERSLRELYQGLAAILPRDGEVLFVDDGSTDGSAGLLRELAGEDPRVRVLRFQRHFGKSTALSAGFRRARGELIATIDADLQEDPADISRLADKIGEGYDVVGAWRHDRRDSRARVLCSRVFNTLVSLTSGVRFRDINCGLKVYRRQVLEDLTLLGGFHRFIPLLAHGQGYRFVEVKVSHAPRRHGKSRYRGERLARGLLDLAVVLFLVRYEGRPGRYFTGIGALLGLSGLGISAYLAGLRLATGSIQSRFPLLAFGLVLLVAGIQLFSLGLFGELLAYHVGSRWGDEPAAWELEGAAREEGEPAAGEAKDDAESLRGARYVRSRPPGRPGRARAREERPPEGSS